jgi:hypothetical protein
MTVVSVLKTCFLAGSGVLGAPEGVLSQVSAFSEGLCPFLDIFWWCPWGVIAPNITGHGMVESHFLVLLKQVFWLVQKSGESYLIPPQAEG